MAGVQRQVEVLVTASTKQAEAALKSFSRGASSAMKGAQVSFGEFAAASRKVGLGLTAIGAAGVISLKKLATAAGNVEQLRIAFTTMLGSAEEADKFLRELTEFASKTPFTLPGVEAGARKLLAVGFAAEEVLPTLKNVGDVAAGLGIGQEGLDRLILNLGQVRTQGRLTGRELRDFAVAGIPLIEELADVMGVAEKEISDLVSAGMITDEVVTEAFKNMTEEGGRFADLMSKQNQTLLGQFSNLEDNLTLLARTLGAPLVGPLTSLNQVLISLSDSLATFVQNNPKLAEFAAKVLLIGTAFAVIVGPILLFIGFIPFLISGITAIGTALLFLSANPIALTIGALAALVLGITVLISNWDFLKQKTIEVWNEIGPTVETGVRTMIAIITLGMSELLIFWAGGWEEMKNTIFNVVELIKLIIVALFETIVGIFTADGERIKAAWGAVWDAIMAIANGIIEGIKGAVTGLVNFVSEKIAGILRRLSSAKAAAAKFISDAPSAFAAGPTAFDQLAQETFNLRNLTGRANGGPVSQDQPFLVGERGPELFVPNKNGNIVPNEQLGGTTVNLNFGDVNISNAMDQESFFLELQTRLSRALKLEQLGSI